MREKKEEEVKHNIKDGNHPTIYRSTEQRLGQVEDELCYVLCENCLSCF